MHARDDERPGNRPNSEHLVRRLALGILATGIVGSTASATSRVATPVRREARVELAFRNDLPTLPDDLRASILDTLGTSDPEVLDYFAADFVVPHATTTEFAAYARRAGNHAAVRWFCAAYAGSDAEPDAPSLRTLLRRTALEGGEDGAQAADALTCPARPRHRRQGFHDPLDFFAHWIAAWQRLILSEAGGEQGIRIATGGCAATAAMRATYDERACEQLLLASARRRRALARMAYLATNTGSCLRLRAGAHLGFRGNERIPSFLTLSTTTDSCE